MAKDTRCSSEDKAKNVAKLPKLKR